MYNCDNCLDFPDRCILLGFLPSLRQSSAISGVINNHGDNQYDRCYFPQNASTDKKSRNGDILGPVELIVRLEQANQGDQREQDDQGEVSTSYLE